LAKRTVYLHNIPLEEALAKWAGAVGKYELSDPKETIAVQDSQGRVTAEPVFARISSPFFHSVAMDGVAVRFVDTLGASEVAPRRLKVGEQAIYVDTGDPLPEGFDAVIMIENIHPVSADEIEIIAPATPWQYVRVVGEDIVATELILPENHLIRPVDVGAMLAGGLT